DGRLGAAAVRSRRADLEPHHQRSARNQSRRLRRLVEAARHHRVGVGRGAMRAAAVLACLVSAAAAAHSVSDEVGFGSAQATADVPGSTVVSNLFSAAFDVSDRWTVFGSAPVTAENGTN